MATQLSIVEREQLLELAKRSGLKRKEFRLPPIQAIERSGPIPLSFAQHGLWFLAQTDGASRAYHLPSGLRLVGDLNRESLVRALDRILERHEALRTRFVSIDGEAAQQIVPAEENRFQLLEHDLRHSGDVSNELERLVAEEARDAFNLETGPLIRGRLIRLAENEHVLLFTMHHLVSDDWSMSIFFRELSSLYGAFLRGEADPLPPLSIQYADYAVWQRRWMKDEILKQSDYWKATLAGAPELLQLPVDRARPARQDYAGAFIELRLNANLTAALKALSKRHGTTLYMTLLAAWATLLSRLSGQQDILTGSPVANRRHAEIEGLIGLLINTLVLRLDLSGSPSISQLLNRVKEQTLSAQQHQDIPFEQVVELVRPARTLAYSPLFQVMFSWHNAPRRTLQLPALQLQRLRSASHVVARMDLTLSFWEAEEGIIGGLDYATSLFDRPTVERYLSYFRTLLEAMVDGDNQAVDRLPLLPAAERRQVLYEWNDTAAEFPSGACIHELFEAQVENSPDAIAVVYEDTKLSYLELNRNANQLAHYLREFGVAPDARVGICLERSLQMMVALLAVLKAGGAYVPLDPGYPAERLRFLLDDSAPVVLITGSHLAAAVAAAGSQLPVIDMAATQDAWRSQPDTNPDPTISGLTSRHLAYVIYTSGSTGRPKGVMIEHRSLVNYLHWAAKTYPLGKSSIVSSSLSFDATVTTLYGPLLCGAETRVLPERQEVDSLAFQIKKAPSLVKITPLFFDLLGQSMRSGAVPSVPGAFVVGGEQLLPATVRMWRDIDPSIRIINEYGPTETVVGCCTFEIPIPITELHTVPIGRPIANTRVYILDAHGEPVPIGVTGELYIGGAGVARGYLNRPELTAERFLRDPFSRQPGARMYRTGDLARWLPDGNIEFLGRNDFQVKLRGFRIELGEVEARLKEDPRVRDAVVVARQDTPGDTRLVAYYTLTDEQTSVDAGDLRSQISAALPEYMIPAAFVPLDTFPLTANGKLDRKALPSPEDSLRGYEAPQGELETVLAAVWAEVLKLDRVGRHDNFFELGGHSLLALRVIAKLRQALGVELTIADLFNRPKLADLAGILQSAADSKLPPIEIAERSGSIPLSFAQQRLWVLAQMEGVSQAYHIPSGLRLQGDLQRESLLRALDRIVARHEALRTRFVSVNGEAVQQIAPAEVSRFHLLEHDLRQSADIENDLERLVAEEARSAFDLEAGPLIRGRLIRLAEDEHVLLFTMHHIVSDGWSLSIFFRELSTLYGAFSRGEADPLPPLTVQYADYAMWQRRWMEGEILKQSEYWKSTLAGAPELLQLPMDHARPAQQDYAGAFAELRLSADLTAALKALSNRHGATLYMTLLASWATLLSRLSGEQDIVTGSPVANRRHAKVEGLIGFFVNILVLRLGLSASPTAKELLQRVKKQTLAAQQHQDISFEQVVELVKPTRSLAYSPLFQAMFAWQNIPRDTFQLPALRMQKLQSASHVVAKLDLTLVLWEAGDAIAGGLNYATSLFERPTIERYLEYFRTLLEAMVLDDTQAVDRLPLLPAAERHQVLYEWNDTAAEFLPSVCIHEVFEVQVEKSPEAVAVVYEDSHLSYCDLNHKSNQLAYYLRGLGVAPDTRVAICLERSLDLMVALLAVLKAGGAYVPMDPSYPAERLRFMLEDSAPAAVITQSHLRGILAANLISAPVLDLTDPAAPWQRCPQSNPKRAAIGLTPEHLAYVIYTSGSTGQPKGVMGTHHAIMNRFQWMYKRYPLKPHEVCCAKSSLSFVDSIWELFGPLLRGTKTVLLPTRFNQDLLQLIGALRRHEVTRLVLVPSMLQTILQLHDHDDVTLPKLEYCFTSGEPLSASLARNYLKIIPNGVLVNLYGSSEVAADATYYEIRCGELVSSVPIGRPIANTQVYVLDAHVEAVPVGVTGELYIGGAGVARGYLNRPALTAERFLRDPFSHEPKARMYRTGDLGRWLPDGNIEFLGRNDFQVKLRGFRIELGEIEARLKEDARIREAVVVAREGTPGDKRLVVYYTLALSETSVDAAELRSQLSATLPEYMVPSAFVPVEAFPLTPNGKLDRRSLPSPETDSVRGYEAPQGEMEMMLAAVWAEVLKLERVGRHDNFFESGGQSLLAVRVIARLRQALSVELTIADLFNRPKLADLARSLQSAADSKLPPIEIAERSGSIPLSFAQQRLWFLAQMEGVGQAYHIPSGLRLEGKLNRESLVRALDRIVARHEALRTRIVSVNGEPVQQIAPAEESRFRLLEHDLRQSADVENDLDRLLVEEARSAFDLEAGPLIRGRLIRLGEDEHVLAFTMHHIVSDGWSLSIFFKEISALYGAFSCGEADPLPPLTVQYADYALWQRRWMEGEILQQQSEYWKATLTGVPELLQLPMDYPRPAQQSYAGALVELKLNADLTVALKALSNRHGATLYMTLLAAWATLLSRLSGEQDIVTGSPVANRRHAQIEGLIGFFVNTLVLRLDLSGSPTVTNILERVKQQTVAAQQHQDLPFEHVVELVKPTRSLAHSPLLQVMFVWQNAPRIAVDLPALKPRSLRSKSHMVAKMDLTLLLWEAGEGIAGGLEYATSLFERPTIERYLSYFRTLLEAMVADDTQTFDRLSLLPVAEREQVLYGWNKTMVEFPSEACLHELFEAQVDKSPDAVAVVYEDRTLSYYELNRQANQLAHYLRARGVAPDVRVALCLERSLEMVVALLAVLKAGGAYVPLDPSYPAERLRFLLEDSVPAAVLTQAQLRGLIQVRQHIPVVDLTEAAGAWQRYPESNPERASIGLTPAHLAYVMYTSGSTGQPKGVMVEHRSVVNRLIWMQSAYGLDRQDAVLQKTPFGFDVSVWEFFWPLLSGAKLILARPEGHKDATYLLEASKRNGVTTLHFVPSMLQAFLDHCEGSEGLNLVRVVCSGEALSAGLAQRFYQELPDATLYNLYGPTETTVDVTAWRCPRDLPEGPVPIGRPIANTQVYILDAHGEPVPVGATGELYIGGAGVARGYLNRPELTAERFLRDPFRGEAGARMYRTGDLGRWLPDGNIEFLGRNDFQVKVRGFRIELGEIEARLKQACLKNDARIREAVVIAREDTPGDKRLVAYYTLAQSETSVDAAELRSQLSAVLPEYMVPAAFVPVDTFPLTPNGKLDRRALPSPNFESGEIRAPHTPTEELLAGIFAEVLRLKQVTIDKSFFDLGGDSISALKLVSRARKAGIVLTLKDVFQHQTIERLARAAIYADNDNDPIFIDNPVGVIPLTPIMRFYEEHGSLTNQFNQSMLLRPPMGLSSETLVSALSAFTDHHDILRSHLSATGSNASLHLEVLPPPLRDIQDRVRTIAIPGVSSTALRGLINGHYRDAQARLDPESGVMFQVLWLNQAETRDSQILLILHHLVVDGVSWRILVPDFMIALEAAVSGQRPAFDSRGTSFRRWSEALNADANTLRREHELPVWEEMLSNSETLLPESNLDPRQDSIATSQGLTLRLSSNITSSLLGPVTAVFGCAVNDALLAALSLALPAWSGRHAGGTQASVVIDVEGHGREALSNEMDLSRTVGWFTSLFPVRLNPGPLPLNSQGLNLTYVSELIAHIQDQLTALPDRGIGYGMLRYLNPDTANALANLPQPQFGFNYLGRFVGATKEIQATVPTVEAGAFRAANKSDAPLIHAIELTALVQDYVNGPELIASWSWASRLFPESVIQDLAESWFEILKQFVECATEASSDASLAVTSRQGTIANLQARIDGGERMDMHSLPIASAPEDMLLQASAFYPEAKTHFIQTLVTIDFPLIATAVDEAFQLLAARNPVLRTSFVMENARVAQVIHGRAEITVSHHDWRSMPVVAESEKMGEIIAQDASLGAPSGPPVLRVSVGTIANDRHQMLLSFNYCAIDGWSFRLLMQEWRLIYKALVQKTAIPANRGSSYSEYLSWLMTKDLRRARSFWKRELQDLDLPTPLAKRPRVYPPAAIGSSKVSVILNEQVTRDIRLLARKVECTENVAFQCAWGLLLSEITDCKDVLFGAAFTGRSVSFKDVENIPGFMVNFLPIRLRLDDHPSFSSLLVSTQAKQHELLDLEYVSLQKIREWCKLEKTHPLFDSILYFQNLAGISKQQVGFFNHDVPYPLRIDVFPSVEEVGTSIHASYRREHFEPSQVTAMLHQYVEILSKLSKVALES